MIYCVRSDGLNAMSHVSMVHVEIRRVDEWQSKERHLHRFWTPRVQEKLRNESTKLKDCFLTVHENTTFLPILILDNKLHAKFNLSTKVAYHARQLSNGTFLQIWESNFSEKKLWIFRFWFSKMLGSYFPMQTFDCFSPVSSGFVPLFQNLIPLRYI